MPNKNQVIPGLGFQHIAIKVHDFEGAVKFYKALGMTEKTGWGDGDQKAALMDTGDGNYIEIFAGGSLGDKPTWGEGAAIIHIALRTTDVDQATKIAKGAGAKITKEPTDVTLGREGNLQAKTRLSFVQSPSGEVLEFFDSKVL